MGMTSLSMVNQKLAYARALLMQVRPLPETNSRERLHRQALLDAGAFHLVCAYGHYLRELGESYSLPSVPRIHSEKDLQQALLAQGKDPAELHELQELRRRADSWLAQLHASYHACWSLPGSPAGGQGARIQAVDLDASAPVVMSCERLEATCEALAELIARHRESTVEC